MTLTTTVCETWNILSKKKLLRLERQIGIGIKCKNKKALLLWIDKRIFFYKWNVHEKEMTVEKFEFIKMSHKLSV